jgi:hypothetical protein
MQHCKVPVTSLSMTWKENAHFVDIEMKSCVVLIETDVIQRVLKTDTLSHE